MSKKIQVVLPRPRTTRAYAPDRYPSLLPRLPFGCSARLAINAACVERLNRARGAPGTLAPAPPTP